MTNADARSDPKTETDFEAAVREGVECVFKGDRPVVAARHVATKHGVEYRVSEVLETIAERVESQTERYVADRDRPLVTHVREDCSQLHGAAVREATAADIARGRDCSHCPHQDLPDLQEVNQ